MEIRELKALLGLMREYNLAELEIEDKKGKVRLVRRQHDEAGADAVAAPGAGASKRTAARPPAASGSANGHAAGTSQTELIPSRSVKTPELGPNQKYIESPMVGTFYRAASPDGAPFVEEGDTVIKGQPLCIIEAMKMMNEIEADAAGRIVKIICDNGQPIEYGQPLMIIEVV